MREQIKAFATRARRAKESFVAGMQRARDEQAQLLARYIEANRETEFGRAHDFANIRTLADYQQRVPIRGFQELAPYIERVVAGERKVLTAADAVLFLSTTGTTGAPKTFPVTREYLRNSVNTMLAYWSTLLDEFPALGERDASMVMLYLAPKAFSKWTAGGVPIHNPTCLPADIRSGFPFAYAPWFPPPAELSDNDRLYYIVRRAAEHPVSGLACLHPSRLQSLSLLLQEETPRLIKDIHDGTVRGAPGLDPNPARAAELSAIAARGPLTAIGIWPGLEFVSCWTGGSFSLYRPEIVERYGGRIFPQTSSSSEAGHITLPIDGRQTDGPLTVQGNVYEFLPVIEGLRVDGATLSLSELELGKTYEIVLTTCTGFYRYVCGDVFRVIDFQHGVPFLEFVGRGGVSDMTGEKISEQHINAAISAGLASRGLEVSAATCCALWGRPPCYEFVFEPTEAWPEDALAELAATLDATLIRQNSRYELKRGFGDLGPARARVIPKGSFALYRAHLVDKGLPATQLKDRLLHTDRAFQDFLDARAEGSPPGGPAA